jgi:chaperonin GroEL
MAIVRNVISGPEARTRLIEGVDILANAVKSTLGARGQTVLIESDNHTRGVTITKDGVTVAKSINLEEPVRNLAVQILKEASEKTATLAGDGTTTSMVLAQAMIHAFETYKKEGQNDTQVLREVKQIVDSVIEMLSSRAIPVTDETLLDVATISANGDTTLGAIIAEAYQKVGPSGVVTVQHSSTSSTYSEVVSGMKLQRGWMSKYFVSDQKKQEAVLEDCYILVSDQEITNLAHIEHLLVPVLNSNKSLLIISELSENALNTLTVNKIKGTIKVCAIVPPQFGSRRAEIMEDIAAATGGVYISDSTGDDLSHIGFNNLGHAERVIVSSDSTVIFTKEINERCSDRISQIRDKMSVEKDEVAKRQLEERMANLAGGVGVIYVGAQSDIEMKEKLDRVDDAVYAVRAALEGGILPGGGIALRDIAVRMCGCSTAKSIVKSAILGPFEAILTNGGYDVYDIASQIAVEAYDESNPAVPKLGYGYDVKAEVVGNMIEMGIIDPLKVTKSALENAVSVATTILSTNVVVYNERA